MTTRHRVALQGFSDFEREALASSFRLAGARDPSYRLVAAMAGSDFIVADADHVLVCDAIVSAGRLDDTVFIGETGPEGASRVLPRPLDPEEVFAWLDEMVAERAETVIPTPPARGRGGGQVGAPRRARRAEVPPVEIVQVRQPEPRDEPRFEPAGTAWWHAPAIGHVDSVEPLIASAPPLAPPGAARRRPTMRVSLPRQVELPELADTVSGGLYDELDSLSQPADLGLADTVSDRFEDTSADTVAAGLDEPQLDSQAGDLDAPVQVTMSIDALDRSQEPALEVELPPELVADPLAPNLPAGPAGRSGVQAWARSPEIQPLDQPFPTLDVEPPPAPRAAPTGTPQVVRPPAQPPAAHDFPPVVADAAGAGTSTARAPAPAPEAAPLSPDEAERERRAAAKAAARAAARRARLLAAGLSEAPDASHDVLILDDSEIARRFLASLLNAFGFTVHEAARSEEALSLLGQRGYVAVFLDIVLDPTDPSDGLDLCQRISQGEIRLAGETPKLLIASGLAQSSDRVRAKLAGCDAFLSKPLTRGDVARALEGCGVRLPSDARRL